MKVDYLQFASFLWAYREIFVWQNYLFNRSRPVRRIFDCGANIGLATLFFKLRWPESTIYCFEPDPLTFSALTQNVTQNKLERVQTFNVALWDSDGEVEFYVPRGSPGSLRMSAIPGRVEGEKISVPSRRLSSLIGDERVDLLKIDVEGAEQRVLQDLRASGKLSLVDAIIAEYHHRVGGDRSRLAQFLSVLETSGFEYQIDAAWRPARSKATEQDVLIYAGRTRP